MKSFCKDLKEHGSKIIGYEKVVMIPLIEENKSCRKQKACQICKNIVNSKFIDINLENVEALPIMFIIEDKKHQEKFLQHFIMVLNMTHFIIKELAEEFKGQFQ